MNYIQLTTSNLKNQLNQCQNILNKYLFKILNAQSQNNELKKAMLYSALSPGKRIRPFLMLASANLFKKNLNNILNTAVSLELIHCSSLIHDDLPSMDNDDLRRGLPSCHIKFNEATAILVGNAFLSLAYEIISKDKNINVNTRIKLIYELSLASGKNGMIGGQMDDIESKNKNLNLKEIISLQQKKTGALFEYACTAGAILSNATIKEKLALKNYAKYFGLAFQLTDDILDIIGIEKEVGKHLHKDYLTNKKTFISLIGIKKTKEYVNKIINAGKQELKIFGNRANILIKLIEKLNNRKK